MERKTFENVEMFARVVEFGANHADLFPKSTKAGQPFAALGAALTTVSDQAAAQLSGKNGVTTTTKLRTAARDALRDQLERISVTVTAISIDTPGIEDKFRMPDQRRDQAMIHAGRAFASQTESLKDDFHQHHMPENFIEDLTAAVNELERAILDQSASKRRRASATRGIDEGLGTCFTCLQRLDAIVANTVADNTPLFAEWHSARHVRMTATRPVAVEAPAAS